ncbi:MAG: hypothetical protein ACLQKA_02420, partial [Bryobacteraceae bacterium]
MWRFGNQAEGITFMFQAKPGTRTGTQGARRDLEVAASIRFKDGGLSHDFHLHASTVTRLRT